MDITPLQLDALMQQLSLSGAAAWAATFGPIAAGAAAAVALLLLARRKRRQRPAAAVNAGQTAVEKSAGEADDEGLFGSLTPALAAQIPESQKESRDFALLLRQAGIYGKAARANIYALRFVLLFGTAVAAAVFALVSPEPYFWSILIGGALLAAGLSIVPRLYVFFRRRARIRAIRAALPDMMDMLGMCVSGGMPLAPSLEHVAENLGPHPDLAKELRILKRQAEVGSLRHALADFALRVDLPEARQVANLLTRGERLGSGLTHSLHEQADHLRSMRHQQATMAANKTPVKLTLPLLFCFAPAALILLIAPALMELNEFLYPRGGRGVLAGNERLGTTQVVRALDELEQDMSAAAARLIP